jgi:predicted metal-dependent phosphoesterase TrpH
VSARRIDLHTHSTASDGTTPPALLVQHARAAGLDVVALTDHDTTAGWSAAVEALPPGMSLVRGAEISCVRDGIPLHLLAYLFDPREPAFASARHELRASRVGRAQRMVALLQGDGLDVTWEQVQGLARGAVGRPHVAQALVVNRVVGSVDEAFGPAWLGQGGRYYVGKRELDVLAAIALVTAAGGVTVFAHPAANKRGRTVGDDVLRAMAAAGLAGLEVDHLDHDEGERAHLRALAAELGLLSTGSSDFHGENKANRLGACLTGEAAYASLVERATGVEVVAG